MRIGTNHGSLSDRIMSQYGDTPLGMVESAMEFIRICEEYNYQDLVLSMKASNTRVMVQAYRLLVNKMSEEKMNYPLHLGVTEAGEGEDGRIKSAVGIGALMEDGLGDTIRVSLTLPNEEKGQEIVEGRKILKDIEEGRFRSVPKNFLDGINIIACPSCSRVENDKFVDLAEEVRHITKYAEKHKITIAVMGCRVNGPGETDDADLGLWCGPSRVNLKKGTETLGSYPYDEILDQLKKELDLIIASGISSEVIST